MAIDFDEPTLSTLKANYLTYVRDNIIAIAKMDFSAASNIPTNAIRYNSSTKKWEVYDGASWDDLATYFDIEVSNLYGMTATINEINAALDGITATALEINRSSDGIGVVDGPPRTIVEEIGDWNMDTTASVTLYPGISFSKIVGVDVLIRDDVGTGLYSLFFSDVPGGTYLQSQGSWYLSVGTQLVLKRLTAGFFDSTSFDSTSYNRGHVVIDYLT